MGHNNILSPHVMEIQWAIKLDLAKNRESIFKRSFQHMLYVQTAS